MKADRFPVIVHNRGKKMRKKTYTACSRMAAIFLAAVLMLTGCGTGAGESSSTGSKETQTTEADDTKTEGQRKTIRQIQKKQTKQMMPKKQRVHLTAKHLI